MKLLICSVIVLLGFDLAVAQITGVQIQRLDSLILTPNPPSGHRGFPRIIKLPNDSLLMVYRQGASHVDYSGKLMKQFGSPDGLVWSNPSLLFDDFSTDDRHGEMIVLPDNSLYLHFYKYKLPNYSANPPIPAYYSLFGCRSYDNGLTFTTPIALDNTSLSMPANYFFNGTRYTDSSGNKLYAYASTSSIINYNGKLILPAFGGETRILQNSSNCYVTDKDRIVFYESQDMGSTWTSRFVNQNDLSNTWLMEPSIIPLSNGEILMHIRTSDTICSPGGRGPLKQAISYDGGQSFTQFEDFPLVGHAPFLYKLNNGVLLSGFRHLNSLLDKQYTSFVYSINEGQSWSDTINIAKPIHDSGYPGFTQINDSIFMTVYYDAFGASIKGVRYKIHVNSGIPLSINQNSASDLHLYPNPTSGDLNIDLSSLMLNNHKLRIFSTSGQIIHEEKLLEQSLSNKKYFDMSSYNDGIYFVEISNPEESIQSKIVLIKE